MPTATCRSWAWAIPPGSWFSYVLSASVLLQVLVLPLTGAVADRTGRKREMLAGFACLGALATTVMFFIADGRWLLGAVLFIVANIAFGAATVVYYSWLPDLAGPDERDAVSSRGWAFGYVGGALLLAVHLGLVLGAESPRPDHRRGGAHLPGHGGPVVGRVHRLHGVPAAQPPGRAIRTPRVAQRLPPARDDAPRDAGLPADPVVPRRLPAVQRRRPDRHRAVGDLRDRGARPRRRRCSPARS